MMDKTDDDDSHRVGYKCPPTRSRFKKGQSGNPQGRPKGSRNLQTLLDQELNAKVSVTEHGRTKRVSKSAVIAKQVVNKAAAGDPKMISMVIARQASSASAEAQAEGNVGSALTISEADRLTLEHVLSRMRKRSDQALAPHAQAQGPSATDSAEEQPAPAPARRRRRLLD